MTLVLDPCYLLSHLPMHFHGISNLNVFDDGDRGLGGGWSDVLNRENRCFSIITVHRIAAASSLDEDFWFCLVFNEVLYCKLPAEHVRCSSIAMSYGHFIRTAFGLPSTEVNKQW